MRALEDPRPTRLLALGAVTAAMLYTHYWALYLLVATGAWLMWRWWRTGEGGAQVRAILVGVLVWIPWSPVFAFPASPYRDALGLVATPADLLGVFGDFAGGGGPGARCSCSPPSPCSFRRFRAHVPAGGPADTGGPGGSTPRARRAYRRGLAARTRPAHGSGPWPR